MTDHEHNQMRARRARGLLWLAGLFIAAVVLLAGTTHAAPMGGGATATVLLAGGEGPHEGQCPGEQGVAGYHHCCSSPSSAIADTAAPVGRDRDGSVAFFAAAIPLGLLVSPDSQPPKLRARI